MIHLCLSLLYVHFGSFTFWCQKWETSSWSRVKTGMGKLQGWSQLSNSRPSLRNWRHWKPSWIEPANPHQQPEDQDLLQDKSLSRCPGNINFRSLRESEMIIWLRIGYCMLSEPSVLSPKKMQGTSFYTTWRELPRKSCNCSLMWRKTPQKLYSSYYKAYLMRGLPPHKSRGSSYSGSKSERSPYRITPILWWCSCCRWNASTLVW